ncbi:D-alanyl-D-alanine carboxypeptidase [Bacillus salacetis]|uniref:D-alanyl-D-alanine carboxypeptidase n=1 Tax=Bacillus salacetis TaxID=2315464 RepID=A0A3A1R6C4_9BACI|nr:D-alanyl-D-alanine carboxypeptidase family protein [Bacillus salacetis]RIW35037.1 D-alanyl-D-alanine carboxypeptidase [Bacillus salacetis]
MKKIIIAIILFILTSQAASANAEENSKPSKLYSESAVMIDTDTGTILYQKNAKRRMTPASITKVATAIYAVENGDLDSMVTISKNAAETEGSSVYLLEGEQLPLKQLIAGMMINSGNDAAVAIAEHLDGSVENFSRNLNEFLKEKAGVNNTHFTNPHGLYDKEHYTTAEDMAHITSYAVKNPAFQELSSLKEYEWKGEGWETTLFNHHKMVKGELVYPEVTGGKNGFIEESKHTLVTTAANESLSVAVILLKAQSKKAAYKDTTSLLDYGLNGFIRNSIPAGKIYKAGDKEFISGNEITYTSLIGDDAELTVDRTGRLTQLMDGKEQLIGELPIVPEQTEPKETKQGQESSTVKSQLVLYPVYLYAALLLIAGTAFLRNKKS